MNKDPIISIITPYYNAEEYIEETAKSVLNQTFLRFEWIIVDDGSSEAGKEKLKKIQKLDKRIKVFIEDRGFDERCRQKTIFQMCTGQHRQEILE